MRDLTDAYLCKGWGADPQPWAGLGRAEGWLVASKRLGPLPRRRWAALSGGCSRAGSEWRAAAAEGAQARRAMA